MFLAMHEFPPIPASVAEIVGAEAGNQRDYAMWGLLGRRAKFPSDLDQLEEAELLTLASDRITRWNPAVHDLVAASDPATVLLTPIRTSTEPGPLAGHHRHPARRRYPQHAADRRDRREHRSPRRAVARGLHIPSSGGREAAARRDRRLRKPDAAIRIRCREDLMANLHRQQRTESRLVLAGMKLTLRMLNAVPALKRRALSS
jgi:hypothetical protein